MSSSKDVDKKVETSQFIDFNDLKAHSENEEIKTENHTHAPPTAESHSQTPPPPSQKGKADSDLIGINTFFSQKNKRLDLKQPPAAELEDGEVPDADSDNENPQDVCRFYQHNSCNWGNSCRFRHPGSTDLGNYVMFESVNLPLPPAEPDMYEGIYKELPPPSSWMGYQDELESSFDTNLRSLKQLMRKAGYKGGNKAAKVRYKHQPWVEFNDLDTDPYYTQLQGTDHKSSLPPDSKWNSTPADRQEDLDFSALNCSSSSSTPDYSSTTDSESSSSRQAQYAGICRKRKHTASTMKLLRAPSNGRRFSSSSSSDTDSSSYGSTTHTSELSSSSASTRRYKSHQEPPCKTRKVAHSHRYSKMKLSRREYLERKLRYVEKQIAKRSRY